MFTNIPSKKSGIGIGASRIENGFFLRTSDGWSIGRVDSTRALEALVIEARDIGYKQAQQDIRLALGMEK